MIKFENVTKIYSGKIKAVDDMSLDLKDGEIVGFIGPNGAGKTTTLKMLTGILNPTTGSISINGYDIAKNPIEAKKQFSFVPDSPDNFLRLKGIEYINFMADIYGVNSEDRLNRISELSKVFEMTDALNDKILSYSHGMRQKIMIIAALIHNPKVWILDEPLTGLDPQSAYKLKEMMKNTAGLNNTVIFSTHVLEVAEKLCDRVVIINKGQVMFIGKLDELKEKYQDYSTLEDIFLKVVNDE